MGRYLAVRGAAPIFALSDGVAIVGSVSTLLAGIGVALISRLFESKSEKWRLREQQQEQQHGQLETVLVDAALSVTEALAAFGRRSTAAGSEKRSETGTELDAKVTGVRRAMNRIAIRFDTAEPLVKSYQRAAACMDDLSTIAFSLEDRQLTDDLNKERQATAKAKEAQSALNEFLEHSRVYLHKHRRSEKFLITAWAPAQPSQPESFFLARRVPDGGLESAGSVSIGLAGEARERLRAQLQAAELPHRRRRQRVRPVEPTMIATVDFHSRARGPVPTPYCGRSRPSADNHCGRIRSAGVPRTPLEPAGSGTHALLVEHGQLDRLWIESCRFRVPAEGGQLSYLNMTVKRLDCLDQDQRARKVSPAKPSDPRRCLLIRCTWSRPPKRMGVPLADV
jgi:hypothetical protein